MRLLLDGGGELSEQEHAWIDAQLSPVARIAEGLQLVSAGVRCGGDISDGLLVELERIADLSGMRRRDLARPAPGGTVAESDFGASWPDLAVGGGEDFELVAAVPEDAVAGAARVAGRRTWRRSPSSVRLLEGADRGRAPSGSEAGSRRGRGRARGTSRERRSGAPARCATEADTLALGERIGTRVEPGDLILLSGQLGAGKTVLVRGIATGMGIDPALVRSPTFVLHHVYRAGAKVLHHLDLYRLGPSADIRLLDIDEMLQSGGVVVVEWGEHAPHQDGRGLDHHRHR